MIDITIIQSNIIWEDKCENLRLYGEKIKNLKTDLIVLPEMFATGFSMNVEEMSEDMDGDIINWMIFNSKEINSAICGSVIIKENNKYYNRFIWVNPSGEIFKYDKRHLFSFSGENEKYTPGSNRIIINYKGFKFCPLICYDLRFPVWSRNNENYDILIYVANWPSSRKQAWRSLLTARSIENQCYTIGVNRVGNDFNDISHSGDSSVINALGETIYTKSHDECVQTITIDKKDLDKVRNLFPFLSDIDEYKIKKVNRKTKN